MPPKVGYCRGKRHRSLGELSLLLVLTFVTILKLLGTPLPIGFDQYQELVRQACGYLRDIRRLMQPPEPSKHSAAYHAFDPAILRRLLSLMPLKFISLPQQSFAWDFYEGLLSGMEDLCVMSASSSILDIKFLLDLISYQPPSPNRTALLRSHARTMLSNIPGFFSAKRLFESLALVSPPSLLNHLSFPISLLPNAAPSQVEAELDKMVEEYLVSFFCNRPRQRRKLCNWMTDWAHMEPRVWALMIDSKSKGPVEHDGFRRLFLAVTALRLMGACHIVLSGLELQMYDDHELPFIWWYGFQVHRSLNETLELLEKECRDKSLETSQFLLSARIWCSLISEFCMTMCLSSLLLVYRQGDFTALREEINLRKRFKWAFESSEHQFIGGNNGQYRDQERLRIPSSIPGDSKDLGGSSSGQRFQNGSIKDHCVPDFETWKHFRELVFQQSVTIRVQEISSLFQSLVEALAVYEEDIGTPNSSDDTPSKSQPASTPVEPVIQSPSSSPPFAPGVLEYMMKTLGRSIPSGVFFTQYNMGTVSLSPILTSLQLELARQMKAVSIANSQCFSDLQCRLSSESEGAEVSNTENGLPPMKVTMNWETCRWFPIFTLIPNSSNLT